MFNLSVGSLLMPAGQCKIWISRWYFKKLKINFSNMQKWLQIYQITEIFSIRDNTIYEEKQQ